MRFTALITILAVCILGARAHPTAGIDVALRGDMFYFPDQTEYLMLASMCPGNMILWPGNRRCYNEGEQGPCNIGRVLKFDRKYLRPFCEDVALYTI